MATQSGGRTRSPRGSRPLSDFINHSFTLTQQGSSSQFISTGKHSFGRLENGPPVRFEVGDVCTIVGVAENRRSVTVRCPKRSPLRIVLNVERGTVGSQSFTRAYACCRTATLVRAIKDDNDRTIVAYGEAGEIVDMQNDGGKVRIKFDCKPDNVYDVDFRWIDIGPRRFTYQNTVNKLAWFRDGCTAKNGDTRASFSKGEEVYVRGIDLARQEVTVAQASIKTTYAVPWTRLVYQSHHSQKNFADFTFKMRKAHTVRINGTDTVLQPSDMGIVKEVVLTPSTASVLRVRTVLKTRGDARVELPMEAIAVGWKVGVVTVDLRAPRVDPLRIADLRLPREADGVHNPGILMEALLLATSRNHNAYSQMNARVQVKLNTEDARRKTANDFRAGVRDVAPKLWQLLGMREYTLEDVISACPEVRQDQDVNTEKANHTAGVYLRVYSDFPADSPYFGKVYIYVGKASDMAQRDSSHKSATKTAKEGTKSWYGIAREARKVEVVQLFRHDKAAGGGTKEGNAMRDIVEQFFLSVFGAYDQQKFERIARLTSAGEQTAEKAVEAAVAARSFLESTQLLTAIASEVLTATKFSGGKSKSGRGEVRGLCTATPILVSPYRSNDDYVKTQYVRTDVGDRFTFRRGATITNVGTGNTNLQFFKLPGTGGRRGSEGARHQFGAYVDANPSVGLVKGTEIWIRWEVMKKGPHEVPYFQVPDVGGYNNGRLDNNAANKVGCHITWYHKAQDQWYSQYVQCVKGEQADKKTFLAEEGSYEPYANGVAFLAYLLRGYWDNAPDWYPQFGTADVHAAEFDNYRQSVKLTPITTEPRNLGRVEFDPNSTLQYMRNTLELDNVDGEWQSDDKSKAKKAADSKLKELNNFAQSTIVGKRDACDCCLMHRLVRALS